MKTPRKPITAAAGTIYIRPLGKRIDNQKKTLLRSKAAYEIKSPQSAKAIVTTTRKSKRNRLKTDFFQSPLPEVEFISKLSAREALHQDKLIVFYKNEFMALRNEENSFFLCQTLQNVYRSTVNIKIRWLSEYKKGDTIFVPDYEDHTEIDCVLTTVEMKKLEQGLLRLPKTEKTRIESILKRAIDVENGILPRPDITEDNPDGLDISLYNDESQIEKKSSLTGDGSATKCGSAKSTASKGNRGKNKSQRKKKMKYQSGGESIERGESDTDKEYKPSCKKAFINSTIQGTNPQRPQRSALAKARAASPMILTTSRSRKSAPVPVPSPLPVPVPEPEPVPVPVPVSVPSLLPVPVIDTSVLSGFENTISIASTSATDVGSQSTVNESTVSTIIPIQNLQLQHQNYQHQNYQNQDYQHQLPQPVEYQHFQPLLPQSYLLFFGTPHPHTSNF